MKRTRRFGAVFLALFLAFLVWFFAVCPQTSFFSARPLVVSELEKKSVVVGDVSLSYRVAGEGPPLLMVMAFAGAMDIWPPELVGALAQKRRLILFDNRGVGDSTVTDEAFSLRLFAQDALGLLDALKIEKADVFGWSMGSLIAQEMALAKPEKVGKLILFGSALRNDEIKKALARMDQMSPEEFVAQLYPAAWAEKHTDMVKNPPMLARPVDPKILARQRKALEEWRGSASRLESLKNDMLLIVGESDDITPPAQSLALAQKVKGAWVARFKGAGHWLMYQNPKAFARLMLSFLETKQDLAF